MQRGWTTYDGSYAPLTAVPAEAVEAGERAQDGPFELADVARLGRRALRRVVRTARADLAPSLQRAVRAHLGPLPGGAAVATEAWAPYDHVNVQAGLDAWLAEPGRRHEVVGVSGFQHTDFGLGELLSAPWGEHGPRPGPLATVNLATGPSGEVRPCVRCGLVLVEEASGARTVLLVRGPEPHGMQEGVVVQALSTEEGAGAAALADVRRLALEHNVFRGQVLAFGGDVFGRGGPLLTFLPRPVLDRSRLVLPEEVLEAVERQVVVVAEQRERLVASGQHLKRGLLLWGPPGTGKTHTVRYLVGRTPGTTVVQLSGGALSMVGTAASVARALAPSIVVVEDVDLIAEDRGMHPGEHPLLFELLNEMDGLAEDADVVFLLTTNRADVLEPALAARPGRVDQAVELGLPDERARRALLDLYTGSLRVEAGALDRAAARTEGVTASFLKELLRRAAVLAARRDAGGQGALDVSGADVDAALDELLDTRNAMTRALLGAGDGASGPGGSGPGAPGPGGPVGPGLLDEPW
ncbi:ATP-binding protein [Vallicoccus soli]|uniref:26S protease regulatory subunit n=1 Tax=Vallicoccus soli TaxID=2339232 RepID=A0A3A3YVC4_9ACTN|nr:ATP-binding protein [Vallicoccus soli]RJK95470.1 26S protease regulatory subunit [Vallicoccus soli]